MHDTGPLYCPVSIKDIALEKQVTWDLYQLPSRILIQVSAEAETVARTARADAMRSSAALRNLTFMN